MVRTTQWIFNILPDAEPVLTGEARGPVPDPETLPWKYLTVLQSMSIMIGNLPNSPITAAFVVFLLTANKYFGNLMCNFSQGISYIVFNKLNGSFLTLADAVFIVPHISLPYNKTGLTVWSNKCKTVSTFWCRSPKHLPVLKFAFNPLLYKSFWQYENVPDDDNKVPKY